MTDDPNSSKNTLIEHSENRIVTLFGLFENEIGPGVLQLTVQKNMYTARKPKPGKGKNSQSQKKF